MKRKMLAAALCLCLCLPGCDFANRPIVNNEAQSVVTPLVDAPDPAAALEKIYENVDIEDVTYASDDDLQELFGIDPALLDNYEVNYTSGRFGVANVFILKPSEGQTVMVRDQLENAKVLCASQYERFDVYNAHEIAQNAPVFEQNGYLIMLMLEDTDAARVAIDQYIPKT